MITLRQGRCLIAARGEVGRDEVRQNGKAQSRESVRASGDRVSTSLFKQKGSIGRASGPKDESLHVSSFGVRPSPMKSYEFAGLA